MKREVFEGMLREFINEEDFAFELFKDVEITDRRYKADFLTCGVALMYHYESEEVKEMAEYTKEYYKNINPDDGVRYLAIEKGKELNGIAKLLKMLAGYGSIDNFDCKLVIHDYQPEILT